MGEGLPRACIPCSGCPGSRARAAPLWLCLGLACASWACVSRHVLRVRCQSGPLDCQVLGSQRGEAVRVVLCVSPAPPDCPVRSGGRQVLGAKVSDACFSLRIRTSAAVGVLQGWGRRGGGSEIAWGRQRLAGLRPWRSREPGPPSCPHSSLGGSAAVPEPHGELCSPGRAGSEEECAG